MSTGWEFLEPWRAVLRDYLIAANAPLNESSRQISLFLFSKNSYLVRRSICLRLPENEAPRLQRVRECMELFTLLSLANNKAFIEQVLSLTETHPAQTNEAFVYFPSWDLRLGGTPSIDLAVDLTEVTWGAFLGFPNDPWKYSPEFQDAARKLEAVGVEASSKACCDGETLIHWECRLHGSRAVGYQSLARSAATPTAFPSHLRSLFDISVPHVVRVCAIRGYTVPLSAGTPAQKPGSVSASIRNWMHPFVLELAVAVARTSMFELKLRLSGEAMNPRQEAMNVGFVLNTLECCRSQSIVSRGMSHIVSDPIRLHNGKLGLTFLWVSDKLFVAICSAVAEASLDANLSSLSMGLDGSGRWPWLIYALCCGPSDVLVPSVEISRGTLTKSDISTIHAVLKTNYPQPIVKSDTTILRQYGFVEIEEGAEVRVCGVNNDEDNEFVAASTCRCRALYDPEDEEWLNFIVPGHGACKTKLGGGNVRFIPDCGNSYFRFKRLSGSLTIKYVTFQSPKVLTDLLALVTSGLRSLTLCGDAEDPATTAIHVDLCALAAACPELQYLGVDDMNVAVSAHDDSLCRWPIKTLSLHEHSGSLSDLTRCLRTSTRRMARQLVILEVTARRHGYDEAEVKELKTHDGEFLPVTKVKFPTTSKAAMISVVLSASSATKPIHRLDAYTLSLIFVFASTPEQRSVVCWCRQFRPRAE